MNGITNFEDIDSWQLARDLNRDVYEATNSDGFATDFSLKDQIRRAAGSIMHNIAEGFGADSNQEFIKFLGYAQRPCSEVQSQLYVALDQAYIHETKFTELYEKADKTGAQVGAFIRYLKNYEAQRKTKNAKQ